MRQRASRFAPEVRSQGPGVKAGRAILGLVLFLAGAGSALAAPILTATPSSVDFGNQPVGSSATRTIALENTGDGFLFFGIDPLPSPGDFAILENNGSEDSSFCRGVLVPLGPNHVCHVTIQFRPTSTGPKSASLRFTSTATISPLTVELHGSGTPPPDPLSPTALLSPAFLTFGDQVVGSSSPTQEITLTNSGEAPLRVNSVTLTGVHAADFSLPSGGESATLTPGQTRTISVRFTPRGAGSRTASLTINDNAPGSPRSVPLSGTGIDTGIPTTRQYAVTDLGTLGGSFSQANGISVTGQVVGFSDTATGELRAFLWENGSMRDLGTLGGDFSLALGISDAGQVVGTSTTAGNADQHAFLWENGRMTDLGTLGGTESFGERVHAGRVVGHSNTTGNAARHAFLWENGKLTDLGTRGGKNSLAFGINASGQVVGYSDIVGDAAFHAFLWENNNMTDLGTLGGRNSAAHDINSSGQVTGISDLLGDTASHAFLWEGGQMTDLGTLGGKNSFAYSINSSGQVVGGSDTAGNMGRRAFLYTGGAMLNLSSLVPDGSGWELTQAVDINDAGQIAGSGRRNGQRRAFLLVPIPENGTGTTPTPAVRLSPLSLTFGDVPVRTASAAQVVTITNSGSAPLTVNRVTLTGTHARDFSATELAGVTMAPGQSRSISVRFTPAGVGDRTATLSIDSNAPDSPHVVALRGTGTPPPTRIEIGPTSLEFENQVVGSASAVQRISITNTGEAPLLISISGDALGGANPTDFFFLQDCVNVSVAPGYSCSLMVQFRPAAIGVRTATLTFRSNAPGSPHTVALRGTGIAPAAPGIGIGPSRLEFEDQAVGSVSEVQRISITNTGTAPLVVSIPNDALGGANPGDFFILQNCSSSPIAPGDSCYLTVQFRPTAVGARAATLTFRSNTPGSPHTVVFSGTGLPVRAPQVRISRTSLNFGNQIVGTASGAQTFSITNMGDAPLVISIAGAALGGANAGDFDFLQDCSNGPITPGNSCTVTIQFKPTAVGLRSANLMFSSNAPGSPHTVALRGTGIVPPTPDISLSPSSLNFGSQLVGTTSATQTVSITNTGDAPLVVSILKEALGGANPGDFFLVETCSNGPITPGNSCTVTIQFTPSESGERRATLTFSSNAPGSPHTITLRGTGAIPLTADIDIDLDSLEFGSQAVGSASPVQAITITNIGSVPLVISIAGNALGGANAGDFFFLQDCTNGPLSPGNSCNLIVQFTPTERGERRATLTFQSSAPGSPHTITLHGTGTAPGP
jgi:probable HAF family extracellular repeat protein